MNKNTKGRHLWKGAAREKRIDSRNHTAKSIVKHGIVWLASNGFIPASLAFWLVNKWGMRHA